MPQFGKHVNFSLHFLASGFQKNSNGSMPKRKKIIQDKKLRGEWAEMQFMARAAEHGLPVSKPWGEMTRFDFVVGTPRHFASVQVKSTAYKVDTGYSCTVRGSHTAYRPGAFDFLAALVVPEDIWYIIPAAAIRGKDSINFYPGSTTSKYELYREAWHLLREAAMGEAAESSVTEETIQRDEKRPSVPANAFERMQAAANYAKRYLQRGRAKEEEE
jgi:hypothetical protein